MNFGGTIIFAAAGGCLLAYRILGEKNKKIYLFLAIQALLSAGAALSLVFLCPKAVRASGAEPKMLISLGAAILILMAGAAGFLLFAFLFKLSGPALYFALAFGSLFALAFVPFAGESLKLFSFPLDGSAPLLAVAVLFVLLVAMDFGKVRFAREEGWLNENRKELWPLTLIITAVTAFMLLFCFFALTGLGLVCAFIMLVFWTLGLAAVVLVGRLHITSRRERAISGWLEESRDYMNVIRSQRHDYNLHLHTLVGLIENEDFDRAKDYMKDMAGEASDVNDIMPLSDAVLGSLLYNMRETARRRGTDIYYTITYDMRDTICSEFECNKIMGNLLQNALDAIHTTEEKAFGIRVRIFKRRGNTVIYVENRYTGEKETILKAFEAGFTTKEKHEGIGLAMVLRTVNRAGGRIYPEFEPDMIRFVVNLPNRINPEET